MKATKTGNGTWTVQIVLQGADGKRHWKRFTHKNKSTALSMAAEYREKHLLYIESMSLGDSLKRFIEKREKVLSPSTIHGYKSNMRTIEKEYAALSSKPVDRITSADLQALIDDMKINGKTVKSMRNRLSLICSVIKAEGFHPPVYNLPHDEIKEKPIPDVELMKMIISAARGTRMELPLSLAIFGLRRGEICGVVAGDLDGNVLHVCRAVVTDDAGHTQIKGPKTRRSDRFVLLPDSVCELLLLYGKAWDSSPNTLTMAWPRLLARAGVPAGQYFRFHDCRAFFASYCHEVLHLTDEQIMALGGWSTDSVMKRHYRRQITGAQQAAVLGLQGILM